MAHSMYGTTSPKDRLTLIKERLKHYHYLTKEAGKTREGRLGLVHKVCELGDYIFDSDIPFLMKEARRLREEVVTLQAYVAELEDALEATRK